jgi:hypothetical protein
MSAIPKVSELDGLKLEAALLRAENLQLQLNAVQQGLQKYHGEYRALSDALKVDGYELRRMQDGVWVYQPLPPAKEAK